MNAEVLCEQLGIDELQLEKLISEGLPWTGTAKKKQFDNDAVVYWLIENGVADVEDDNIVKSTEEVGAALGVTGKAVEYWMKQEGFPGRVGYMPLDEIREWRKIWEDRRKSPKKDDGEDKLSIQDELRKLKLEQARSELISLHEVQGEFTRQSSHVRSELHNIPAKVESRLPSDLSPELVSMIREVLVSTIDESMKILREIIGDLEEEV
jgi:phage terminase Nu1 subunit (DNA packaging protein)